jgi:hypothetical protein
MFRAQWFTEVSRRVAMRAQHRFLGAGARSARPHGRGEKPDNSSSRRDQHRGGGAVCSAIDEWAVPRGVDTGFHAAMGISVALR